MTDAEARRRSTSARALTLAGITLAVALAGLLLGIGLVAYYGFDAVTTALLAVGWGGFAVLVCYHLGLYGLLGLAWVALLPHRSHRALAACLGGRAVRDAGSEILPLSQLGGLLMGARAATLLGLPATLAVASTVIDVTLELVAQFAFTVAGLALLTRWQPASPFLVPTLIALALAGLAISGFIAAHLIGLGPAERVARRLAARLIPAAAVGNASVQDGIRAIYRRPGRLVLGFLLHVAV